MRGYHYHHAHDWLNEIAVGAAVCVGTVVGVGLIITITHAIMGLLN